MKKCTHCGMKGHGVEQCFKIIGYPGWYDKLKGNQALSKTAGNSANTVDTTSSQPDSPLDMDLSYNEQASKEKKIEETKIRRLRRQREETRNEILKQFEAIAIVRSEVDQLSQKVTTLQAMVDSGRRVDEKEFLVSSELLMVQLLKLDGVEAEGEAKVQRKNEVRRIQGYVDTLDALKAKNSNPFGTCTSSVSVTT